MLQTLSCSKGLVTLEKMPALKRCLHSTSSNFFQRSKIEDIQTITRPWNEVPQPPTYPIIGNGNLYLKKENITSMDKVIIPIVSMVLTL